jgi:monofunctional biosynthetic peptidoglycan transglycosylase
LFAKLSIITYQIYYYKDHNPEITSLIKYKIKQAKKENKNYNYSFKYVPLKKISPTLKIAIISSEDPNFFYHHGFDFQQIKESFLIDLKHRKILRGASTITMQLARTLFLNPEKTFRRKAAEAVITILIETILPKERIFELYLNYVELGNGIFGVEEASHYYFKRNNNQLTYSQILALTGAIASPGVTDPAHPNKWLMWKMRIINNKYKLLPKKTKDLIIKKY